MDTELKMDKSKTDTSIPLGQKSPKLTQSQNDNEDIVMDAILEDLGIARIPTDIDGTKYKVKVPASFDPIFTSTQKSPNETSSNHQGTQNGLPESRYRGWTTSSDNRNYGGIQPPPKPNKDHPMDQSIPENKEKDSKNPNLEYVDITPNEMKS